MYMRMSCRTCFNVTRRLCSVAWPPAATQLIFDSSFFEPRVICNIQISRIHILLRTNRGISRFCSRRTRADSIQIVHKGVPRKYDEESSVPNELGRMRLHRPIVDPRR